MKITVSTGEFKAAVEKLYKVVSGKGNTYALENILISNMDKKELDIYCDLLSAAYKLLEHETGLVCGTAAETLRDTLYNFAKLAVYASAEELISK